MPNAREISGRATLRFSRIRLENWRKVVPIDTELYLVGEELGGPIRPPPGRIAQGLLWAVLDGVGPLLLKNFTPS